MNRDLEWRRGQIEPPEPHPVKRMLFGVAAALVILALAYIGLVI